VLINSARVRGGRAALIEALQHGTIAGAALDVYEVEPLPKDSPLLRMDNVMLAPHNANSSRQPGAGSLDHHPHLLAGLGITPPEKNPSYNKLNQIEHRI